MIPVIRVGDHKYLEDLITPLSIDSLRKACWKIPDQFKFNILA